jgi:hypothetical protein
MVEPLKTQTGIQTTVHRRNRMAAKIPQPFENRTNLSDIPFMFGLIFRFRNSLKMIIQKLVLFGIWILSVLAYAANK